MVSHGFSSSVERSPAILELEKVTRSRHEALDPIRSYFLISGHEAIESDQDEYHADFSK